MGIVRSLLPLFVFVTLFLGSGLFALAQGSLYGLYAYSPLVMMLPALMVAWILFKGTTEQKANALLEGMRHKDILGMVVIFMLAGAFVSVTKSIGAIDAVVNMVLSFVSADFVLVGVFLSAAVIATAIGTSMGTIATVTPFAIELAHKTGICPELVAGTVVGGAMFGDNLSLISDTTIAAVAAVQASMKEKLLINGFIASIAAIITCGLLWKFHSITIVPTYESFNPLLLVPYCLLLFLALAGVHVFVAISVSLLVAGLIGFYVVQGYSLELFGSTIQSGFLSMFEIVVLSLMVGGLSGLSGTAGIDALINRIVHWMGRKSKRVRTIVGQFVIAGVVSLFDLLLANNTIAIIVSGPFARSIVHQTDISTAHAAAWLDIFSCVMQGLIPYGAQLLLVSSLANVSPFAVVPYVYYCYALAIVSVVYIVTKYRYIEKS